MYILLLSMAVAVSMVTITSASCIVCPQTLLNDQSTTFCARNSNGMTNITQSQFANWNCNHPFNRFTIVSQTACPPGQNTLALCGIDPCANNGGPAVCATLGLTTAVFANLCELNYFNCRNPTRRFTANLQSPLACTSIGL